MTAARSGKPVDWRAPRLIETDDPEFFSTALDTVTNLLPKTSDGVPIWALVLLALFLAARELFRWLNARPKGDPKEVKPEPSPTPAALPIAMQIDIRDKVHEIGHDVKQLMQQGVAMDARPTSIWRELRDLRAGDRSAVHYPPVPVCKRAVVPSGARGPFNLGEVAHAQAVATY